MTSKEKALLICKLLSEKKGENIVYIDVASKSSLCDYFVIAGGRSSTAVKALCENLEEKLEKEYGVMPERRDGGREGRCGRKKYCGRRGLRRRKKRGGRKEYRGGKSRQPGGKGEAGGDGGRIGTGQESGGSEAGHSRSGVAAGEKGGGSETGGKGSR